MLAGPRGAPEPTIIDLRKPADLNLVYQSVLNGWDVPQHIRDQIVEQTIAAADAAAHYLQVTDEHFAKAARPKGGTESGTVEGGMGRNGAEISPQYQEKPGISGQF